MSFYSASIAPYAPWADRTGQLSILRLLVFIALLIPGVSILSDLFFGPIRPEPYEHALHEMGEWAVRFLIVSLAVTPARRIFRWNKIIGVRRMIGLAALGYGLLHLVLYMAQENFDLAKVVSEIVLRIYLTIGFVALLGLIALGATSFDKAVRKMGRRWTQLHKAAYSIAFLALLHYFLQSKADVYAPTLLTGVFVLLMLYRIAVWRKLPIDNVLTLIAVATLAACATAGLEYAWYALATNLPAERVFSANFSLAYTWRPAIWVGVGGLAVAGLKILVWATGQTIGRLKSA
ncbi:sulfoxide reductase heme-binding subunit YedZ [Roseibium sp. CAU 1637]|uniref:Protein-methionine-sulfoxide reductase heme-binding subunit MsrQ n=1 Tax=Roseibium limicola TaxID=2816037 RepID=A0A939EQ76_9HYPH|nr:protein-methionine-sulfoxide reductase heme-binding subunit MsrQ [Roseibium limicola]MBO0346721.1 sulfoxide reductase heme-binding subunit YedZ [Roseibium limicola]